MAQLFSLGGMKRIFSILGFVILAYVLVYSVLSLCGKYQPISVGAAGVKDYAWAPSGFYDPDHAWSGSAYAVRHPTEKTGGWSRAMMLVFFPLWYLDARYIHSESRMPPNNSLQATAAAPSSSD